MAARKRISQVNITSSGQYSGNFSTRCPFESGSSKESNWFLFLLTEILKSGTGGNIRLPIDEAGREIILINRGEISSITITLS
jgi:hypothetical protein